MKKRSKKETIKPRSKLFPEPIGRTVRLSEGVSDILRYNLEKMHILENRLFPYMEKESEHELFSRMIRDCRKAGIPEHKIYAFVKTQRLLSEKNIKYLNEEEIQEWNDAIDEFKKSKNKNLIDKALNDLSKDKQCPDLSKNELSALFHSRNFHPILIEKCENTFINNHMKETVINGIMAILNDIKEQTGRVDLDGSDLVDNIFSPDNPTLKYHSYEFGDDTEQRGIHFLFKGFVLAIRNQFLHRDIYLENPFITIEYLSFFNFLFLILDGMKLSD